MDNKNIFIVSFGITFLLVLFLFLFFNSSNTDDKEKNILKTISLSEWKNYYDNDKNYIILDVRTPEEYNQGHIKNSVNINFYDTDFKEQLSKLDKDKKYLIYCRSGSRSSKTLDLTKELKFNKVYNLNGGILGWNKAGFNTIK